MSHIDFEEIPILEETTTLEVPFVDIGLLSGTILFLYLFLKSLRSV